VSRQHTSDSPKINYGPSEAPKGDDQLQIDLRFGLDEVVAAEMELLRRKPRRRPTRRELADLAGQLYDARRQRDRLFNGDLLGEPAWDMLLALYAMPYRGVALGVTSLSHAAQVPEATGIRWQKVLLRQELICRGPHVSDLRVQLVGLSDKGRQVMERYLIRLFYSESDLAQVEEFLS
jgi:DNA-binding MarR family transcriptional regulator